MGGRKALFLLDSGGKIAEQFQPITQVVKRFSHVPGDTGLVEITGIGFEPSAVYFTAINIGTTEISHGTDLISSGHVVYTAPITWSETAGESIYLQGASGNQKARVLLTSDDSFTLSWSKTGTPAGSLIMIHARCVK